jgi:hypothetical protein
VVAPARFFVLAAVVACNRPSRSESVSVSSATVAAPRTAEAVRLAEAPTGGDPASAAELAKFDAFLDDELARRKPDRR